MLLHNVRMMQNTHFYNIVGQRKADKQVTVLWGLLLLSIVTTKIYLNGKQGCCLAENTAEPLTSVSFKSVDRPLIN